MFSRDFLTGGRFSGLRISLESSCFYKTPHSRKSMINTHMGQVVKILIAGYYRRIISYCNIQAKQGRENDHRQGHQEVESNVSFWKE